MCRGDALGGWSGAGRRGGSGQACAKLSGSPHVLAVKCYTQKYAA